MKLSDGLNDLGMAAVKLQKRCCLCGKEIPCVHIPDVDTAVCTPPTPTQKQLMDTLIVEEDRKAMAYLACATGGFIDGGSVED